MLLSQLTDDDNKNDDNYYDDDDDKSISESDDLTIVTEVSSYKYTM